MIINILACIRKAVVEILRLFFDKIKNPCKSLSYKGLITVSAGGLEPPVDYQSVPPYSKTFFRIIPIIFLIALQN